MKGRHTSNQLDGDMNLVIMSEAKTLERISAYIAEKRLKVALEAEVEYMVVEAKKAIVHLEGHGIDFEPEPPDKEQHEVQSERLDAIYDEEPLGFERDPLAPNLKMLVHGPLEEIDLGEGTKKRPTYITVNLGPKLKVKVIQILKEYKDCFTWDYDEMPELSRELVELKLPIDPGRKPIK